MKKMLLNLYDSFLRPVLFRIRTWWPFWFYILNKHAREQFITYPPRLTSLQEKLITEIKRDGITTTTIEEFFGSEYTLQSLIEYIKNLPKMPEGEKQSKKDTFMKRLWPVRIHLDFQNPFVGISLNKNVLAVVNTYMNMWSKLKYYDLSQTVPVPGSQTREFSQNWHRDPEEKRLIKMFIYLSDVLDEGAGPFIYVPQSVYGAKYGHLFPQQTPKGSYPSDSDIEKYIPPNDQKMMLGKAGTIIFCDTSGIHRGGYSIHYPRTMFTASYTAPSSTQEVWYWGAKGELPPLSPEAEYALTPLLSFSEP